MPRNIDLSEPISLRLPKELLAQIERIAETTERSRSWVIVRALKRYVVSEGADILAIAEGREQVGKGEVADFDDTLAEAEKIVSAGKAA